MAHPPYGSARKGTYPICSGRCVAAILRRFVKVNWKGSAGDGSVGLSRRGTENPAG